MVLDRAAVGGRLRVRATSRGTVAVLELPLAPAGRFSVGLQARLNLLSNLRYWSGRGVFTYFFGNQPASSSP